jgi:hypothetical protein
MDFFPFLFVIFIGIVIMAVSRALDLLWVRTIPIRAFYYFIRFPGVVIHECSHILGCILVGAKIKKVVLFSKGGGLVTYTQSGVPYLGDVIICTAPFFIIPLTLALITWVFGTYLGCTIPLEPFALDPQGMTTDITSRTFSIFAENLYYRFNGWFLLYLYLTTSLVLSLAPSTQDLKNAAAGICILIGIGLLVIWTGVPELVTALNTVIRISGTGLSLGLMFELIALLCSLPAVAWYGLGHR